MTFNRTIRISNNPNVAAASIKSMMARTNAYIAIFMAFFLVMRIFWCNGNITSSNSHRKKQQRASNTNIIHTLSCIHLLNSAANKANTMILMIITSHLVRVLIISCTCNFFIIVVCFFVFYNISIWYNMSIYFYIST